MSEIKGREWHNCFYIGSLNHKATSSLLGQPKFGFHYIQKFYKSHTKIFEQSNTQDFWFTQKSRVTSCKNHTHKPEITLGKQPKVQELQNLMMALPSQPYTSSSS